jgi:uncharacterized membrane protein
MPKLIDFNKEEDLFKVGFFIAVIILLIIGFSIGYFAKDKS